MCATNYTISSKVFVFTLNIKQIFFHFGVRNYGKLNRPASFLNKD